MEIEERAVGTVTVLDVKGRLTLGDGEVLLRDKVRTLVSQGCRQIVLNLAEMPYMDSAALGEMVRSHTTMNRENGHLKLSNVPKRIRELLVVTKLATVFDIFETEAEALRSFADSGGQA